MLMREVVRHERKTRQDRMCGGESSDGNQPITGAVLRPLTK